MWYPRSTPGCSRARRFSPPAKPACRTNCWKADHGKLGHHHRPCRRMCSCRPDTPYTHHPSCLSLRQQSLLQRIEARYRIPIGASMKSSSLGLPLERSERGPRLDQKARKPLQRSGTLDEHGWLRSARPSCRSVRDRRPRRYTMPLNNGWHPCRYRPSAFRLKRFQSSGSTCRTCRNASNPPSSWLCSSIRNCYIPIL
ncbi:hypothetical protein D3C77_283500 [compost metagenome]